ncbi:sugar transporter-like protein 44 [Elsinoe australis]|uniref:Sugar transporter-like protein 44 n=1 Tax=Elsinoe australis TaxID=40998 RepID=A0A4U7AQ07_9PEZI|nr:sugar transporter-like protein 44 [Elsinoe australis]
MGILQKIVKNDAMKSDPAEIYGWRVFALTASACFGGATFGIDIGIIGGVLTLPTFQRDYKLLGLSKVARADLQANIVSTLQCGCFVGALAASWMADKWGRRIALLMAATIVIIGCVFQAAASGILPVMFIGRFIAGLGVGAASVITPLYVSENAPRAIRGGLTGIYQLFIATGTMLAFWTNYGAILHLKGTSMYIFPLISQAFPAITLFVCMFLCQESPRWLAKADRWEDAERVLTNLRQLPADHDYIRHELGEIREQLEHERRLIGGASFMDLQREMWLIPGNRKRALISVGLMICQQMTGTNAINYYAPQIFQNLGLNSSESGLFATGIYGVVKMVTCASFLLFAADSLGRRRSLLWTSIAQGATMFYVGIYVRISPPVVGQAVPPAGYFALVCIFLFAAFFQFGWGPCCWIYVSEIPTARLRSMNVSLASATQWLFNLVVARATPNMLATVGKGGYGAFLIYGSFCFSMFFFVWFLIPETKGVSLEKMDDLFGVTELVKKLEDDRESFGGSSGEKNTGNVEVIEAAPRK